MRGRQASGVKLSVAQRDALAQLVPSLAIAPTAGRSNEYDLTPDRCIGAVQLDDLAVEIQPKVPIEHVLFMLSYTVGVEKRKTERFSFGRSPSVIEAVIPSFLRHVEHAFRRGLLQGYRQTEDKLNTVRGRIRLEDQIQRRFNIAPPIEVRYDEYTEDIVENRLIKAALFALGRHRLRNLALRQGLRRYDPVLAPVSLVPYTRHQVPTLTYTRLNRRYEPATELARVILGGAAFELRHGKVTGHAVVFDMAKVVEDFIVVALREGLRLSAKAFCQGASGKTLHLDDRRRVSLEPDLSWWDRNRCRFVGDVKYKLLKEGKPDRADLYQMLAYTIAADLPAGLLIYAASDAAPLTYAVPLANKQLNVVTLDLGQSPTQILEQLASLARKIRQVGILAA